MYWGLEEVLLKVERQEIRNPSVGRCRDHHHPQQRAQNASVKERVGDENRCTALERGHEIHQSQRTDPRGREPPIGF